jgi:hypothetical protein
MFELQPGFGADAVSVQAAVHGPGLQDFILLLPQSVMQLVHSARDPTNPSTDTDRK